MPASRARADGVGGGRAQRVAEADEAEQLDVSVELVLVRGRPSSQRSPTASTRSPSSAHSIASSESLRRSLRRRAATLEQRLGCALDDDAAAGRARGRRTSDASARGRTGPRGRACARRRSGDRPPASPRRRAGTRRRPDRRRREAPSSSSRSSAVEARTTGLEHVRRVPSGARPHAGDAELVDGERAGLVRRDHGRGAERLDRGEPADDRSARGHRARTLREGDRHRRRQALGHRGDRDRDADEERLLERRVRERASPPSEDA